MKIHCKALLRALVLLIGWLMPVAASTASDTVKQLVVLDAPEPNARSIPQVVWAGNGLVATLAGRDTTRIVAATVDRDGTISNLRTLDLAGGGVAEVSVLGSNHVAVGLPRAPSTGGDRADGVAIMQTGTAAWSQGVSVEQAGKVVFLEIRPAEIAEVGGLVAPSPKTWGRYGAALATNGELLVVGASDRIAGAVHLYVLNDKRNGAQLVESVVGGPAYGSAVSLVGDTLLVGAPGKGCCDGVVETHAARSGTLMRIDRKPNPDPSTPITYGAVLAGLRGAIVVGGEGMNLGDGVVEPGGLDVYTIANHSLDKRLRLTPGVIKSQAYRGNRAAVSTDADHVWLWHDGELLRFRRQGTVWSVSRRRLAPVGAGRVAIAATGNRVAVVRSLVRNKKFGGWQVQIYDDF